MQSEDLKYINNGVSQDERLPPALLPGNVKIDDRDTISMVSFLGAYSDLLNYYKYDAYSDSVIKDGNWDFFINNAIFRLAEIATAPLSQVQRDIYICLNALQDKNTSTDEKIYALRLLFGTITKVLVTINKWLAYVDVLPEKYVLRLTQTVQNDLSDLLVVTRGSALFYEKHVNSSKYIYFDTDVLKSFDQKYWLVGNVYYYDEKLNKEIDPDTDDSNAILYKTSDQIVKTAQDILHNFNRLINLAKDSFNEIITDQSGTITPDVGLLITFLKLLENARKKINNLTGKHLDFYYKKVLKLSEALQVPDKTFLIMQLANNFSGLQIDSGTQFDAGKDSLGNTITFGAIKNTVLNQAQIVDLRTLFVASNPILNNLHTQKKATNFITGIYNATNSIPVPPTSVGFPALGEDQLMFSENDKTMQDTSLGFAISSAAFFLSGGKRILTVAFNFTESSFAANFVSQLGALAANDNSPGGHDSTFLFNSVFSNTFSVSATGAKGWFQLQNVSVSYSVTPSSSLIFNLTLDSMEEAVVAYDTKLHGASYNTPYPVLSFVLLHNFPYYAYNFLNNLELTNISVKTEVSEFKNTILYNQDAPLDASKPFRPLGVQPEKGSYFLIGNNELFIKNVTEIDVAIEWQTLPVTGDFETYYASYNASPPFNNNSFRVAASFLYTNKWVTPAGYPSGFNLFNVNSGTLDSSTKGVLANTTTFQFTKLENVVKNPAIDPATINVPLKYDQNTPCGFIKLELVSPQIGFGASMYSNVLSTTVMENARLQLEQMNPPKKKSDAKEVEPAQPVQNPAPLPYQPFTPVAQSVTVSYKAEDIIDIMTETKNGISFDYFYHIDAFTTHPAMLQSIALLPNTAKQNSKLAGSCKFLLPVYFNQGNLYIGLSGLQAPETVNILIQLSEKVVEATIADPDKIVKWSYLSLNEWKDFKDGSNIHDDTQGLITSGIVTLDIPSDISTGNIIMPANLYWLRVSATDHLDIFSNIIAISTQVIEVEYSNPKLSQRNALSIPSGTISKTLNVIPGLKSVSQPFASKGGVAAEDETAFYTRVSERLRHKKRAITPWDYERIVLQNFPDVYKAKCIANSSQQKNTPGNVDLVVIASVNYYETVDNREAGPVFGFTVLEAIKKYLQQFASPHAKITIRNPVYEKLIVKCDVKFYDNNPFFIQKLNKDISDFLSPWIKGNSIAYNIGEGLQKSTILAFIQQLDYVEFVTGFSIIKFSELNGKYHFYDSAKATIENTEEEPDETTPLKDKDILYAISPYSVFISGGQHIITPIDKIAYIKPSPFGVDDLSIDTDFIIGDGNNLTGAPDNNTNFYMI